VDSTKTDLKVNQFRLILGNLSPIKVINKKSECVAAELRQQTKNISL